MKNWKGLASSYRNVGEGKCRGRAGARTEVISYVAHILFFSPFCVFMKKGKGGNR